MTRRRWVVLGLVLMAMTLFTTYWQAASYRGDGWRDVDTGPFTVSLPPGMRYIKQQGIDSFVGEFRSKSLAITFDYGMYTGDLSDWAKTGTFERVTIHGRPANIASRQTNNPEYPYEIACKTGTLWMGADCKGSSDAAVARRIFESARLHKWRDPTLWERIQIWWAMRRAGM